MRLWERRLLRNCILHPSESTEVCCSWYNNKKAQDAALYVYQQSCDRYRNPKTAQSIELEGGRSDSWCKVDVWNHWLCPFNDPPTFLSYKVTIFLGKPSVRIGFQDLEIAERKVCCKVHVRSVRSWQKFSYLHLMFILWNPPLSKVGILDRFLSTKVDYNIDKGLI